MGNCFNTGPEWPQDSWTCPDCGKQLERERDSRPTKDSRRVWECGCGWRKTVVEDAHTDVNRESIDLQEPIRRSKCFE
jgi:predicted RNA-binding Zn-ribbon protein involved in translation (DUF1610 family)